MNDDPLDTSFAQRTGAYVPAEPALSADGPFPQPFGRYELRACLGRGGMGTVFLAYDTRLDVEVALKVPHAKLLELPGLLERFYREARAAARLWHPNLCQVLDINEHAGIHYLTMRYIDGVPLAERPPADLRAAAAMLRSIALALVEAHRFGIIHRDLNPRNVLVTPAGQPVITDFGVALRLGGDDDRMTMPGDRVGTPAYMAPEQIDGDLTAIGPATDIYALGVILYWMLTGRLPFRAGDFETLRVRVLEGEPARPSALNHEVPPALEDICLRAMARRIPDRFGSARELADALTGYIGSPPAAAAHRPLVEREAIRFAFVGMGEQAPPSHGPGDRLFLDVGNDLRPGVIDHHQLTAYSGSTTGLVLSHPELIDAAVVLTRRRDDPFTLVLHEHPDLDCVASAYLACAYLATGSFPGGAEALGRYVDKVDEGALGLTLANPFALYAAYHRLAHNHDAPDRANPERWRHAVDGAMKLIDHVLAEVRGGQALLEVDAFAGTTLLSDDDRTAVRDDIRRYERKLVDPRSHARQVRLRLPGQYGGKMLVEALLVRDVQNGDDPEHVLFFKDWARSDARRAGNGRGFIALSVFMSEGAQQVRRCILSLVPDAGASLRGLGSLLDQAESERRRQLYGVDDRVKDPATGAAKPARPGYANSDPWYDGRAHGFTIVDAPRAGTLLTADEIEGLFLRFGGAPA